MMRTVTTATSASSVCLTCETRLSCPADTFVSATPVRTLCGTRPTTAPSAGCVRSVTFLKKKKKKLCHAIWAGLDSINEFINECICFPAFRALLQIRAVRKKPGALSPVSFSPVLAQTMDHDEHSVSFLTSYASYLTALTVNIFFLNLYYNIKINNKSTFLFHWLFAGHRLSSSWLRAHLTVRGPEWFALGVSCHPISPPLWWHQFLRGSGRGQQTVKLSRAFKRWKSAERQSQQVTWQVI